MSAVRKLGPEQLMPGFELFDVDVGGRHHSPCRNRRRWGALLLLHGHPQTHVTWRKVAPALAEHFRVIAADLRGYGDSAKPEGCGDHAAYSKRAMAADQVALMRALGHDRGGRVARRMALDHSAAVSRLAVLDIAPTATMYARTDKAFATRYFWWFFLIQPAPLPGGHDRPRSRVLPT